MNKKRNIKPNLITGRTTNLHPNDSNVVHYEHAYNEVFSIEAFAYGFISLLLTIINIICIIVTGWGILKVKEVTPDKIPQHFSSFWKKDLKVHREYLNTIKDGKTLIDEARQVLGTYKSREHALEDTFLHTMFEKVHVDEDMINIREWVTKPTPGVSKVKKYSTSSMYYPGSFERDDLTVRNRNSSSSKEAAHKDSLDVEPGVSHFRIRAFSEGHGEMMRQKLHTQAQLIIASSRSQDLNETNT